jgi:hypothetical protein
MVMTFYAPTNREKLSDDLRRSEENTTRSLMPLIRKW